MNILSVKEFNAMGEEQWENALKESIKLHPFGDRPNLAEYVYFKTYGYVAYGPGWRLWAKTKKKAMDAGILKEDRQTLLTDKIKNAAHQP